MPWMFALDHIHYSRWLPVHIGEIMQLMNKNPTILAEFEASRLGTKADLLHCLQLEEIQETNALVVNAKIFAGAAVVQMLHPGTAKTFQEYADAVFTP